MDVEQHHSNQEADQAHEEAPETHAGEEPVVPIPAEPEQPPEAPAEPMEIDLDMPPEHMDEPPLQVGRWPALDPLPFLFPLTPLPAQVLGSIPNLPHSSSMGRGAMTSTLSKKASLPVNPVDMSLDDTGSRTPVSRQAGGTHTVGSRGILHSASMVHRKQDQPSAPDSPTRQLSPAGSPKRHRNPKTPVFSPQKRALDVYAMRSLRASIAKQEEEEKIKSESKRERAVCGQPGAR